MKKNIIYCIGILFTLVLINSCKKADKEDSGLKSVFSYVADGYKVNFTNFSTGATEYSWTFGDASGQTSAAKSPQHIFTQKGDYLVTLTAKSGGATSIFKDSVSIIGPNIKIDGDFSDWQYVPYTHENAATYPGTLRAVKTFASSKLINFYFEGTAGMNMDIIDLYIDSDNNPATGFSTFLYPAGSGANFLCEGKPNVFGDVFAHSGPPTGFSFTPVSTFGDAMNFSEIKTAGGKKVIEFSIKKTVLGPVANFVNFCLVESTSGYAEIGKIPEAQTPASKFLAIPL